MSLLDRLDRRFGRWAVPNVTLPLVFLQSLAWFLLQAKPEALENFLLIRDRVLEGQWWRLVSFVLIPPNTNVLFLFFALYMFWLMGTALENQWGAFRYNIYLLIAYLATLIAAMIAPNGVATNAFIGGSVFLAFAHLYPDFVILIAFIFPVKIKWIALVTWIGYLLSLAIGDWTTRALVVASVLNFLLFFGKDVYQRARSGRKRMVNQMERLNERDKPFNTCVVCGVTEKSNPKMEFRYCGQCKGTPCYCLDHIGAHEHR